MLTACIHIFSETLFCEDFADFILYPFTLHRVTVDVREVWFKRLFNEKINHMKVLGRDLYIRGVIFFR